MKTFQDGDPLFGAMMHAIANLWPNGTAVLSGCAPTGSSTTRQVTVAGGTVVINGTVVSVSQQIKTLDAATFDRYDLISINTSGAVVATKGTEERRVPAIPANTVPIAICLVETGQTALPTDRIYDTRLLASLVIAAAIECYGAIGCQTGNVGAQQGFIDSPGNTTRKSFSPGTVLAQNETATVATTTIPANYSSAVDSNLRITIVKSTDSTYDHYLGVTIKRNGETIGSGSIAHNVGSGNIDTTGGCKAGDTITVEAKNVWGGTYAVANITIYTVTFKTTRRADIPAYKVFPEAGTW